MQSDHNNRPTEPDVRASVSTPDLGIDPQECLRPASSDPCTIVIVGATGDLTARKLIPALFNLYLNDGLTEPFQQTIETWHST